MVNETGEKTHNIDSHIQPETSKINLGKAFATEFTRQAILRNTEQRLPLSVLKSQSEIFTPEMMDVAKRNRWISPVESARGEDDPDIALDKKVYSAAIDRILSQWDKENDPQEKLEVLKKRYDLVKETGSFRTSGYVNLDEMVDEEKCQ